MQTTHYAQTMKWLADRPEIWDLPPFDLVELIYKAGLYKRTTVKRDVVHTLKKMIEVIKYIRK